MGKFKELSAAQYNIKQIRWWRRPIIAIHRRIMYIAGAAGYRGYIVPDGYMIERYRDDLTVEYVKWDELRQNWVIVDFKPKKATRWLIDRMVFEDE